MTVQDPYHVDKQNKSIKYCRALLELLQPWSKGIDQTTGMLELGLWKNAPTAHPKMLGAIQCYGMFAILQSMHLVPDNGEKYYVNNYVD